MRAASARAGLPLAIISALLALTAGSAEAQNPRSVLTLTGTVVFPTPTANDYAAGYVYSTAGVGFSIDATHGNEPHTTIILIRSLSTSLGGGKLIGDLEWRRSDLATWTSVSLTNVEVERQPQIRNVLNDPWSNTIFFRMRLNWATDPPGMYGANYQLTLSQTVP